MSGGRDSVSGTPIDFVRLNVVAERFATSDRSTEIDIQPEFVPDRIVCHYGSGFYPQRVQSARLEIAWLENGDFSIHYHEEHREGEFDHRWDQHLSGHNTRGHVHPGPGAPTPDGDASYPAEWRDVLSMVLGGVEARRRALWTE